MCVCVCGLSSQWRLANVSYANKKGLGGAKEGEEEERGERRGKERRAG